MEAHRRRFNKVGLSKGSLLHYIKNHPSFLGHIKSKRFGKEGGNTSCYAFDYDILNLNILEAEQDSDELTKEIFSQFEK